MELCSLLQETRGKPSISVLWQLQASCGPGRLPTCLLLLCSLLSGAISRRFIKVFICMVQGWTRPQRGGSLPFFQGRRQPYAHASNYCHIPAPPERGTGSLMHLRSAHSVAEIYKQKPLICITGIPHPFLSRVPNTAVLHRASCSATSLIQRQLLLFGKVLRSPLDHPLHVSAFMPGTLQPARSTETGMGF